MLALCAQAQAKPFVASRQAARKAVVVQAVQKPVAAAR